MGEQSLYRDLGPERVAAFDLKPGDVAGHRIVDAELAFVAQLHYADACE
jgi:hypothetical protein